LLPKTTSSWPFYTYSLSCPPLGCCYCYCCCVRPTCIGIICIVSGNPVRIPEVNKERKDPIRPPSFSPSFSQSRHCRVHTFLTFFQPQHSQSIMVPVRTATIDVTRPGGANERAGLFLCRSFGEKQGGIVCAGLVPPNFCPATGRNEAINWFLLHGTPQRIGPHQAVDQVVAVAICGQPDLLFAARVAQVRFKVPRAVLLFSAQKKGPTPFRVPLVDVVVEFDPGRRRTAGKVAPEPTATGAGQSRTKTTSDRCPATNTR
jgi:hypothetical protein